MTLRYTPDLNTVSFDEKNEELVIIDQTLLPYETRFLNLSDIKDIRDAFRHISGLQTGLHLLEKRLWHTMLQRGCHATSKMGGKVSNQEGDILGRTETVYFVEGGKRKVERGPFDWLRGRSEE